MKIQAKNNPYEKPVLVIRTSILKWLKQRGFRVSGVTPRAVNDAVIDILEKAIIRTKLDKMKTVCPKHI